MKLLACIVFHYKEARLVYLRQVLQMQQFLAPEVHVVVTTNTTDESELASIRAISPPNTDRYNFAIDSFGDLPNPWLLPWAHKV
ncbi:MAG: hypothetical protein NTX56_04690, partial [Proteobacteria bacterium]|nr:hypothetical protein [Pseudomonadota bacterium]